MKTPLFLILSALTLIPAEGRFRVGPEVFPSLEAARDHVRSLPKTSPIEVLVDGGNYQIDRPITFGPQDSGTSDAPITYRATGPVTFGGSQALSLEGLSLVKEESELARLSEEARGKVVRLPIRDEVAIRTLQKASPTSCLLTQGEELLHLSRFPNVGFAHAKELLEADEGTRFQKNPVMGTWDEPKGALITLREKPAGSFSQWAKELEESRKVMTYGYLSAQWYRSQLQVRSVDPATGAIRFVRQSRYGLDEMVHKFQSRQAYYHLLCEIDEPGEWYYDSSSKALYLWPVDEISPETRLAISAGSGFLHLENASHLRFLGFSAQGFASGHIVKIAGGTDNLVAGGKLFNSTASAISVNGQNNTVTGYDVFDVTRFVSLSGGVASPTEITPAGNEVSNCHFYLDALNGVSPAAGISGVGNVFRNNLMHNIPGQAIVFRGNDHLIERNELFNIGFEEGDGATIYSGAEFWGYGVQLKHNFLHHIMSTDGLMTRSGIMLDDHQSGTEVIENIFYKTGHGSLAINGGTGLKVYGNIFLHGNYGVWVRIIGDWKGRVKNLARFDSGELKRGDKHDYIWRCEQVVGKEGWNQEPWIKYPTFAKVMNQPNEWRFLPIENDVRGTLGHGMRNQLTYRHPQIPEDRLQFHDTREIEPREIFADVDELDFSYRGEREDWMPAIPFAEIGLVADQYRHAVPDKSKYRKLVKERFEERPSSEPRAKYDFDHVNETIYWNSGSVLKKL
ncbi:right-handed parallel beta-helix repeat-containing protein [Roseibacillus persicicus]|uniref:Right handed beta helix domain-containing protein n=1 Tax=Roseibacillus persicicus TaxID=454148 RepID=A0A918WMD6_9BACT|nr:right-handed parallel beta-helix repeat-containing protein [Roseibacillus persicicus]GHC56771.1 hypothetical protein GCM10007100_24460 [Roseibacillus persicicus]